MAGLMILILLSWSIGLLPVCVMSAKSCPPACVCFGTMVDCSENGLNKVPEDLPYWVEILNLSKNPSLTFTNESLTDLPKLNSLSLEDLNLKKFPNLGALPTLKILSLSGNFLEKTTSSWSSGLPLLTELDISRNRFQHFNLSQISNDVSLRRIDLKNNEISSVYPSPGATFPSLVDLRLPRNKIDDEAFQNLSGLFNAMPNLKTLDLNRNLIRRPEGLKFFNLTNLTVLKLKRNKIEELPDGLFYGLKSLTTLRLDNNSNITEISNGWLFEQRALKVLSLSHNNISIIKDNSWETTESLAVLDLSFNRLGTPCSHRDPTFKALAKLQDLFLSHNCLSTLDRETFGDLPRLKILDLSYNKLQWSIEDDTGAFKGLRSLVSLNLAYNKIETIHGKVLHPLSSLTSLDLSGNNLKTLPQNPFKNMRHLSRLYFNTSSLVCDCHLAWLPEWLATQSFNSVKAKCGYPTDLEGASIFRLLATDLSCDISPQPVISEFPGKQTALYGKNLSLECLAHAKEEKPTFTWTKDRKIVEPFRIKTFVGVEDVQKGQTIYQVASRLVIENVTHYDKGSYQCIARNSYGPSYSPPADVIVHRFPYFTETPISVEVKEGDVVVLKCAASGYPTPNILLNKEGGFPAPKEKRLNYYSNEYSIKPVLPKDDGVYICTASNEAGAVNVTARVSVIYPPSFSRPLYNQVATVGQSIALECQGTGYPVPKVTWFREDKLVMLDDSHVTVDGGQFLLILKVTNEDFGSYRCELTNTLGTQRRSINLTQKQEHLFPALTGLIVMVVVICVVITSFMWVLIIYKMRKRAQRRSRGPDNNRRGGNLDQILQEPLTQDQLRGKPLKATNELHAMTPLLPVPHHTHPGVELPPTGQDSSSEHSSGKDSGDSGVGESAQRSSEDLHPNGDGSLRISNVRRSLLIYPDSPTGLSLKGQNLLPPSRATSEEMRPRLSTFGSHNSDQSRPPGYNPSYASLRRGSASRCLPVPSPVTPGMGINSLPRHAYRGHSNSLVSKHPNDRCSSLSRRRPSKPDTPPPRRNITPENRNNPQSVAELVSSMNNMSDANRHYIPGTQSSRTDMPETQSTQNKMPEPPSSRACIPDSQSRNMPNTRKYLPETQSIRNLSDSYSGRHSRPDTPPPTGLTEMEGPQPVGGSFRSLNGLIKGPPGPQGPQTHSGDSYSKGEPTYYTFRGPERHPKTKNAHLHLLPTR